ncbi:unnamed protein product [Caenorhabditis sp. 36 PRJEB53466]|nr:unnamed protein product [Caenorhabditis sp. 36 PRJEB53466]
MPSITFDEQLTEQRIEGKVRQLVSLVARVPLKDVGILFSWKDVLDEKQRAEFNEIVAEALTAYFQVSTEPSDVDNLNYFWEIVNRITCKC